MTGMRSGRQSAQPGLKGRGQGDSRDSRDSRDSKGWFISVRGADAQGSWERRTPVRPSLEGAEDMRPGGKFRLALPPGLNP